MAPLTRPLKCRCETQIEILTDCSTRKCYLFESITARSSLFVGALTLSRYKSGVMDNLNTLLDQFEEKDSDKSDHSSPRESKDS